MLLIPRRFSRPNPLCPRSKPASNVYLTALATRLTTFPYAERPLGQATLTSIALAFACSFLAK
jgi:hypothetical protein